MFTTAKSLTHSKRFTMQNRLRHGAITSQFHNRWFSSSTTSNDQSSSGNEDQPKLSFVERNPNLKQIFDRSSEDALFPKVKNADEIETKEEI